MIMCGKPTNTQTSRQCRFANCKSCCFPLRSHKIWALAGAVSTTLKSKSSTVSGCTRLHSAYRSSAPTFGSHMVLMCCMLPASLGPSPLMIFDVNLSTKFGRSPWGSIHAFSQWDDKMPFLRIKLHSLQLKKGIEGKEQKLLEVWISLYSCVCWPSWAPHAENAGTQSEDCCLTVIWRDASVREACQIVGAGTTEIQVP